MALAERKTCMTLQKNHYLLILPMCIIIILAASFDSPRAQVSPPPSPDVEIVAQRAHADQIIDVAVSPNGNYFLTAGRDNVLKIWDIKGTLLKNISIPDTRLSRIGYSADGRGIFAISERNEVLLYDPYGHHLNTLSGEAFDIKVLFCDPTGRTIITSDGNGDFAIRNMGWQIQRTVAAHKDSLTCLAVSPNGELLASGSDRPTETQSGWNVSVRLWDRQGNWVRDIETEMAKGLSAEGETPYIRTPAALRFSPDGQRIAILDQDGWVHVRSIQGELLSRFQLKNAIDRPCLIFSADGQALIFPTDDAIEIYDLKGTPKQRFSVPEPSERSRIENLAASIDGTHFIVSLRYHDAWTRSGLKIFDAQGHLQQSLSAQDIEIESVGLAPDLSRIIFEQKRGEASLVYPVSGSSLDFVPASFGYDNQGQEYRYAFDKDRCLQLTHGQVEKELKLKFDKNSYFVTPFQQIIQVHPGSEELVFFDFSGNPKQRITIDRYHTGGMGLYEQHGFSPAGDYLVVETDSNNGAVHSLTLIRLSDGQRLNRIDVGMALSAYAVSPSGELILTGHENGDIQVWSRDGKRLQQFKAHSREVTSLAIDPTQRYVISLSKDKTIKLWDRHKDRTLTMVLFAPEEWFAYDGLGHFDCSAAARERVRFVKGLDAYHFRQFWDDFFQPGLIGRFLQGEELKTEKIADSIQTAPTVSLQLLKGGNAGGPQASVTLKACVQAAANGVGRIVLFHNGRAVDENSRGIQVRAQDACREFETLLLPGQNIFYAAAFDRSQTVSGESETISVHFQPESPGTPEMYVLCVGISDYRDENIILKYPADDAAAVSDILKRQGASLYGQVHSDLLVNASASKADILKKMDEIVKAAQKSDTVIFYLAGHGETEKEQYYFLGYDADLTNLTGTCLAMSDISRFMQTLPANKIAIFIDTCKSGSATQLAAMGGLARSIEERRIMANLAKESGIAVFSAASKTQAAYEIPALQHGIFTYCLLDAMQNRTTEIKNGELISLSKLLAVVNRATRDTAKKHLDVEQSPIIYMFGDDFSLGLIK